MVESELFAPKGGRTPGSFAKIFVANEAKSAKRHPICSMPSEMNGFSDQLVRAAMLSDAVGAHFNRSAVELSTPVAAKTAGSFQDGAIQFKPISL
jgi:hypothetical protein